MLCSRLYLENIGIVDRGIRALVDIIEESFDHDGKTSFVFTSDHGITNWGKVAFVARHRTLLKPFNCES
jgi:hypothetical protein